MAEFKDRAAGQAAVARARQQNPQGRGDARSRLEGHGQRKYGASERTETVEAHPMSDQLVDLLREIAAQNRMLLRLTLAEELFQKPYFYLFVREMEQVEAIIRKENFLGRTMTHMDEPQSG